MKDLKDYLVIAPEVSRALEEGLPVVALESTIISHGMPYPDNVKTALAVEGEVRARGAVPATIALFDGEIRVGLTGDEIDRLGREGLSVTKTSRRDMPFVLARKVTGATTVAGTMIAASLAGIRFFATGGIGGVHRGAEETMDISADLVEFQKTAVAVVCSGAKSILDIGLTLEHLETGGVPVIGYGTDEMPAFYTRESGFPLVLRADDPETVAGAFRISQTLGFPGGMVIANPIPQESAMDHAVITAAIEEALKEAAEEGISGKEVTPFLLDKVATRTGGDSLKSNIALVLNNARLAADIAVAYAGRKALG
ncbi:MAG TPA: pseudouridine-5'-phosphate glycosidase [Clostridiaceae bacterium]|nr:pseudouridine-5'-phosphate glycosidase [Clostridiaceae bacterium]